MSGSARTEASRRAEPGRRDVIVAIIFYSLCSSLMLVVNKLAMMSYRVPAVVNLLQLSTCSVFIWMIGQVGYKTDALTLEHAKPYAIYVCAFAGSIYANMKALAASNVETIIVFRACSPFCT